MSAADAAGDARAAAEPIPPRAIRNVAALAAAQAILGGLMMVHIAFGPLAAAKLAENPAWATLPITVAVLANAATAAPFSFLTARIGRRAGFLIGVACAVVGAALGAVAIVVQSFELFLLASVGFGAYQACQNLFRFAATDAAPPAFKPKAMSYVMAGGLAAAFIGPAVANGFVDAIVGAPIAGVYAGLAGLALVGALPLLALDSPPVSRADRAAAARAAPPRPALEVLRAPGILPAMICGAVAYATMSLVMTATSSAMVICGHAASDAMMVIGAHVFAMFAPSFFTGSLIARFGHRPIIWTGLALEGACALVAQTGIGMLPFSAALILLGVGWNFAFIGASSLLTARHHDEDRARVQAINEVTVFGTMAVASLASGLLHDAFGWTWVTLATLPGLAIAALSLVSIGAGRDPAADRPAHA